MLTSDRFKRHAVFGVGMVMFLLGLGIGYCASIYIHQLNKLAASGGSRNSISKQADKNVTPLSLFESKLSADNLKSLQSITMPLYLPPNNSKLLAPLLQHSSNDNWTALSYDHGYTAKNGLSPGQYVITIYTSNSTFSPPASCTMAGIHSRDVQSKQEPCPALPGATDDAPAYLMHGMGTAVITNSKFPDISTVYMQKDTAILAAVTTTQDALNAYNYLLTLRPVAINRLPANSMFQNLDKNPTDKDVIQ